MAKVIWAEPTLLQLEEVLAYIALDKPSVAARIAAEVTVRTSNFGKFKALGRKVPEIDNPKYRQFWLKPVMIYYRVEATAVYIVHVRRGEQMLDVEDIFVSDS